MYSRNDNRGVRPPNKNWFAVLALGWLVAMHAYVMADDHVARRCIIILGSALIWFYGISSYETTGRTALLYITSADATLLAALAYVVAGNFQACVPFGIALGLAVWAFARDLRGESVGSYSGSREANLVAGLPSARMKFSNSATYLSLAKLAASGMLFGALARHPYDYYTLLRWLVCGVSAFAAVRAVNAKQTGWVCTFIIVALIFNPVIPVHLKRETWAPIDVLVALLLLVSVPFTD